MPFTLCEKKQKAQDSNLSKLNKSKVAYLHLIEKNHSSSILIIIYASTISYEQKLYQVIECQLLW